MNKIKCTICGLVNFSNALECKRCGTSLSQRFQNRSVPNTSKMAADFTVENRKFGLISFIAGVISSIAPWVLTFYFQIVYGKLNGLFVVFGFSFIVLGLGILISPPKTKLDAEKNKPRNGIFLLIGLLLGLVEAYFFNKTLGLW